MSLLIGIFGLVLLECSFYLLINFLRKKFQWLITAKDEKPFFKTEGLEKFLERGYDPELGWVRKPNSSGEDKGKFGRTKFKIDSIGSRVNPGHEVYPVKISCYGDSFTFCRQVNDNETWQWYLSEYTKSNVLNYGVGNYGIDQALLRLKRCFLKNSTDIVILGVVPDTIRRILSIWKHYHEYGNIFGFKPRFILKNGSLNLIPNLIDDKNKFFETPKYIEEIKKNDFFYNAKFRKEIIKFPYLFYTFKNANRNLKIVSLLLFSMLFNKVNHNNMPSIYPLPNKVIMKSNFDSRVKLYNDDEAFNLLIAIINEFFNYAKECNFKPILAIFPQKDDIMFIRRKYNYYKKMIEQIRKENNVIDLLDSLYGFDDLDELFSQDDQYGGHFNSKGNQIVGQQIHEYLRNESLIR